MTSCYLCRMTTVIIGSGNVAWHMAKTFVESKINLIQIFGRNLSELEKLSNITSVKYSTTKLEKADFYLICTSDKAIYEVSKQIPYDDVLVAHTSGTLHYDILNGNYRKASFYPLQTFSKDRVLDYSKIPFFIDAETDLDNSFLVNLALKIGGHANIINHEQRKQLHLSAVFACNFVNHMYAIAENICRENSVNFKYLLPIIEETADKIKNFSPRDMQTGPAVRNDKNIIGFQEKLIKEENIYKIYKTITESIRKMYEL